MVDNMDQIRLKKRYKRLYKRLKSMIDKVPEGKEIYEFYNFYGGKEIGRLEGKLDEIESQMTEESMEEVIKYEELLNDKR